MCAHQCLKGGGHIIPTSVLLVRACHMDKSKVKEQRNIFVLSTEEIKKYMDIRSGKVLRPLTQPTARVIAYFHTLKENRA